jgi:phosphate transport system permease protein
LAEFFEATADTAAMGGREGRRRTGFGVRPFGDRLFALTTLGLGLIILSILFGLALSLVFGSTASIEKFGLGFIVSTDWDPANDRYGALPFIYGTIISSALALLIAVPLSLGTALYLSETAPEWLSRRIGFLVELLAAIPSVVYGLWGIFVVIPFVRPPSNWLHSHLGWIPIFGTSLSGPGLLPASLVLAIMILPTISAISRDALIAVPPKMREAAFGIGATRWEAILAIFIPTAATGIFGAVILGFGRALGETMALAMLAGNANVLSWSLFSPANTLAALLANHFPEAGNVEVGALMYAALVLLGITLVVNVVGTLILERADAGLKGLR